MTRRFNYGPSIQNALSLLFLLWRLISNPFAQFHELFSIPLAKVSLSLTDTLYSFPNPASNQNSKSPRPAKSLERFPPTLNSRYYPNPSLLNLFTHDTMHKALYMSFHNLDVKVMRVKRSMIKCIPHAETYPRAKKSNGTSSAGMSYSL